MTNFKDTLLWEKLTDVSENHKEASQRLEEAYLKFRKNISALTGLIVKTLPELTIHDATHLDGLWGTGSLLIDKEYQINPMEVFVFGCAVLLHDSALSEEAFDGLENLRNTLEWKDAFAFATRGDQHNDLDQIKKDCDFEAIRRLHAKQAGHLATKEWLTGDGEGKLFLLEDSGLRNHSGEMMGAVASSHHWDIERVILEFATQFNPIPDFPRDWVVDRMKIAALLRCADALHIDQSRAPDFLHALIKKNGISVNHWQAQNWLAQPAINLEDPTGQTLVFTSTKEFPEENSEDWWIAYDAIAVANQEIQASNNMLESSKNEEALPFKVKRIIGADSPKILSKYVRVSGWNPVSAQIHVSDIASLVESLGGQNLYGVADFRGKLLIVMRELLQNSVDAIKARKAMEAEFDAKVVITVEKHDKRLQLTISDSGIGMSERVLTGPFLDFSSSFWSSTLVNDEIPGLLSTGFKSGGRFGIGFYSSFMVADVIAVRSRRYETGLDKTRTLKFENGISLRPKLLIGDDSKSMARTTSISLDLKDDDFANNPVFPFQPNAGNTDPVDISLRDAVALLVSALDEVILVQIEDGDEEVVHSGLPTPTDENEKTNWLRNHLGQSHYLSLPDNQLQIIANNLRYIDDEQPWLGLAAINPFNHERTGSGIRTVGGLRPQLAGGDSNFFGFIDCEPDSAKRNPKEWVADKNLIMNWAQQQIDILKSMQLDTTQWHFISARLPSFGIDPSPYLTMPVLFGQQAVILDLNTIAQILTSQPIIVLVEERINRVHQSHETQLENAAPLLYPFANAWAAMFEDYSSEVQKYSFLACLDRQLANINKKLTLSITPTAIISNFNMPVHRFTLSSTDI